MEAQLRSAILRNMQLDLNIWDSPSHRQRCEADGGGGAAFMQAGIDSPSPPEPSAAEAAGVPKNEPEPSAAAAAGLPKNGPEPSPGPKTQTQKRPAAAVKADTPKEPAAKRSLKRPAAAEKRPADAEPAVKSEKDEGLGASLKRPAAAEIEKNEGELGSSFAAPDADADSSSKRPKAERSYSSQDGVWEAGGNNKIVLAFEAASARGYTRLASTKTINPVRSSSTRV